MKDDRYMLHMMMDDTATCYKEFLQFGNNMPDFGNTLPDFVNKMKEDDNYGRKSSLIRRGAKKASYYLMRCQLL